MERAGATGQGGRDQLFASHFQGAGAFRSPVRFSGGAGNDRVVGGKKADRLSGGAGNRSFCDGERGRDRLRGCESGGESPELP